MSEKEILVQAIPASEAQDAEKSQQFTFNEHSTGFWQALRLYWPAFLWGLFINLVRRQRCTETMQKQASD